MTNDSTQTRTVTNRHPVDETSATTADKLINRIEHETHGSNSVATHFDNWSHRLKNHIEQWWIRNIPNPSVLLVGLSIITVCLTAASYYFFEIFDYYSSAASLQQRYMMTMIVGGGVLTVIAVTVAVWTPKTRVWHRDPPDGSIVTERIAATESTEATITVDEPQRTPLPYEMTQTDTPHGIETCDMDECSLLVTSYARPINRDLPRSTVKPANSLRSSPTDWPLIQLLQSVSELSCPWEVRVSILGTTDLCGDQDERDPETDKNTALRSEKGAQVSIQILAAPSTNEESAVRTQLAQLPSLPMADTYLYAGEPHEISVSEADDPFHVTPRTERTTQSGHRCRHAIGVTSKELLQVLTVPKGVDPAVDDIIKTQFGGQPRAPPDPGHTGVDAAADTASVQSSVDTSLDNAGDHKDDGPWEWSHSTDNN